MRLTAFLLKRKLPRGHIFRGKYRLVKQVDAKGRADLRHAYAIEEQNMFYLRHPYLSVEQSRGHAAALGKPQEWLDRFRQIRTRPWRESVTLEERLAHLRCKEAWD
ncbi:large ribosomal subunit protein mL63 isoform X2 [Bacillus rossius redtenbacheri]|uniref:large ribosomal subunit protein mL63 isoform X2 n=1 Tax=Bacillus rossius redtenbacheri TaxID=93214 RepID=UPI002FDE868E